MSVAAFKVGLDTNILAYAEGTNGAVMKRTAVVLVNRLPQHSVVLPVQVLAELFRVLVRKAGRKPDVARALVLSWRDSFPVIETSSVAIMAAMDLVVDHQLSFWDAVVLAACAEAGCRLLLSEDIQDGFIWNGVTIINPFAKRRHPLLEALLMEEQ